MKKLFILILTLLSAVNMLAQNVQYLDADGNTQIIEVLSSRGRLVGSNKVRPGDEDKLLASVTEILPGAFEDCDYITGVDLRGVTQLDSLPDDCFKNCDKLNQVILPENIKAVGHNAFQGTMEGVEVVVYGEEVYLPNDTFWCYMHMWLFGKKGAT